VSLLPNHLASIIKRRKKMITKEIKLINELGLHARAALKFVETSLNYKSEIVVTHGEKTANGKSIIELMLLSASSFLYSNSVLILNINGEDEEECMNSLVELIENRFGEAEFPAITFGM
jgi:phosphocarrier protein HPr